MYTTLRVSADTRLGRSDTRLTIFSVFSGLLFSLSAQADPDTEQALGERVASAATAHVGLGRWAVVDLIQGTDSPTGLSLWANGTEQLAPEQLRANCFEGIVYLATDANEKTAGFMPRASVAELFARAKAQADGIRIDDKITGIAEDALMFFDVTHIVARPRTKRIAYLSEWLSALGASDAKPLDIGSQSHRRLRPGSVIFFGGQHAAVVTDQSGNHTTIVDLTAEATGGLPLGRPFQQVALRDRVEETRESFNTIRDNILSSGHAVAKFVLPGFGEISFGHGISAEPVPNFIRQQLPAQLPIAVAENPWAALRDMNYARRSTSERGGSRRKGQRRK